MITPHLAPCLVVLRAQFNNLNATRDKASDGWIADGNHSATSDHQPDGRGVVHALDVDSSGPWPDGLSMQAIVDEIVRSHRDGKDDRLTYVIYNRRIWSASRDWVGRDYDDANPHDKHAHFSCARTVAKERDASAFTIIREATVATQFNADDKEALYAAAKRTATTAQQATGGGLRSDVGEGVWHHGFERSADSPARTPAWSNVQAIYDEIQELKAALAALGVTLTRMSDQLDALTANPTPPAS